MSAWQACPSVYEINTWVWLHELGRQHGRAMTLDQVPDDELERLAAYGFDALWLMGVWERSPGGRAVALRDIAHEEYARALPDWTPEDVVGSPYAVYRYRVDPTLGSDEALATLRRRLERLGLGLILDFVPNHLALDHSWLSEHPERLLHGSGDSLLREPRNYFRAEAGGKHLVLAHGRDPYFPGWTDTVQLDYRRPKTRRAMSDLLLELAGRCDGVRCDMAMLLTADVFRRTWGGEIDPPGAEFWPDAIARVKASHPDFLLLAEVYWNLEYTLQQMGFDYTYDKRLYDRLRGNDVDGVRAHLHADLGYLRRLARFVENHDESRALVAFGRQRAPAAATLTLGLPGLRLLHEGQLEGRRVKLPVQLGRRALEPPEPGLEPFYRRLLAELRQPVMRQGAWSLLQPHPEQGLVAYRWSLGEEQRIVVVNLWPEPARATLPFDLPGPAARSWSLDDLLARTPSVAPRLAGSDLVLDVAGYGCHLFAPRPAS